ncbi:MAG: hypothetical protein KUA43_13620 [Hoeflea sp.]|uniref:hypothetical protein n=1 Tax=Hoeflea sp. TaxID=1940281 RepID=UPI001DDF3DC8|nr:hypothetical protein [Hoeflea sp.]MBU4531196.1 hypothetical protein [Alphaproteobacteria bacterium]MBU4545742.1 hypothetical protein [Alphaproteobacteria bacterium]MBU4550711.1 hypothetical protein [Alphaproteobacteria bacterium]MBV1724473.1 hypothetical protein [Hoeflea sp.]MBV1760493.1 hypothetical protein [Hoeflea sp.]
MKLLQAVIAAATLGLGALIIIAVADGSFYEAGSWLFSEPWGLVTLADLYLGFLLSALIIWFFEPRPLKALIWILPIPILGNLWTAVWFVIRLPHLRERMARR